MSSIAVHIKTDGTITRVVPAKGERFTLQELQGFVGGYIERVFTRLDQPMYVNEDGMSLALPLNLTATRLMSPEYLSLGGVLGDVVVMLRELPDTDEESETV